MSHNPHPHTLRSHIRRFAFTVGTAVSLYMVSISGNLSHSLSYYARINDLPSEYAIVASLVLLLGMSIGLGLIAAGLRSGPGLLVVIATMNALISADYLGNHSVTMLVVFPLFQSLACLLVLNTRNHRRFVSMLQVRRRRKTRAAEPLIS